MVELAEHAVEKVPEGRIVAIAGLSPTFVVVVGSD